MTAIMIGVAFLAGAMAGAAVLLRVGMAGEESGKPLACQPTTRSASATRRVVGLYVMSPWIVTTAGHVADRAGAGRRQLPTAPAPCR